MSADAARQAIARHDKAAAANAVNEAIGFSDKLGSRATAPIYSELSSVSIVGPIEAAKANTGAPAGPPAVKAVAGGYTRIVLDANLARARLLAAKAELASGDLARADADLRAIQNGVVLESVSANLPLVRARENLNLAKTSAQSGNTAAAKSQMQAAQKALADFARLSPASPHASQAQTLANQIASAAQSADATHPISTAQLDQWWTQIADWTDQA
jgi:hypothetical protein